MNRKQKVCGRVWRRTWLNSLMMAGVIFMQSVAQATEWQTVSSETYTLLWKDLTFTRLQVDPQQALPENGDILNPSYAKQIIIEYKVGVSAERFQKMTNKALEGAFSEQELAPAAADIARFCSWYLAVEKGDHYQLTWVPDEGLGLALNGRQLGIVSSPESAAIILSVWLGRAAVSEEQRDTMLAAWREALSG
ncbi:chalcone isomerase family protein [Zhongshania aquimaris]|uniref:Chalcone isomerase family protein n=1 Tax=Zhongshania aquimaris TaxID=2857107 RepID=A0ABS6VRJ9_9GAMM|nr:chalcone isomerase family protein [Zhongshania aquimaris]MBW2940950.1 chalcone isomerase family protein [Zhongshania aquimaris]